MLRYQPTLPQLPIPSLSSTLSKYLDTVKPILTPSQFAHTQRTADAFLSSPLAADLQKRLHDRAERVGDNWLSEWWNDVAYMGYRDPVVVFVSYFFVHVQDRTTKDGTQRAAELIKAMIPFRTMVET
jgi:carnitine O-acetyltransferase